MKRKSEAIADLRAQYVVRAFMAGLSTESCVWVFKMPLAMVEETIRQWSKECDK
jgi:hypothetical protein